MNNIYKAANSRLRIQDGHLHPEGSLGNPVITFHASTSTRLANIPVSHASFETILQPVRALDLPGTLFQGSQASWIVLEHPRVTQTQGYWVRRKGEV